MFRQRGLTDDERVEYQELGNFARQDDAVHLGFSAIALPTLFAAVSYAWVNRDSVVPLFIGSLVVWVYWWIVRGRRSKWVDLRYRRLRRLEDKAGMWHHREIHWADGRRGYLQRMTSIKTFEVYASLVLLLGWVYLVSLPIFALFAILVADLVIAYWLDEFKNQPRTMVAE